MSPTGGCPRAEPPLHGCRHPAVRPRHHRPPQEPQLPRQASQGPTRWTSQAKCSKRPHRPAVTPTKEIYVFCHTWILLAAVIHMFDGGALQPYLFSIVGKIVVILWSTYLVAVGIGGWYEEGIDSG